MQRKNLKPTEILVLEEYTYQSKVSGVRSLKLASMPTGLIFVRVPYDNYKLSTSASQVTKGVLSTSTGWEAGSQNLLVISSAAIME